VDELASEPGEVDSERRRRRQHRSSSSSSSSSSGNRASREEPFRESQSSVVSQPSFNAPATERQDTSTHTRAHTHTSSSAPALAPASTVPERSTEVSASPSTLSSPLVSLGLPLTSPLPKSGGLGRLNDV
jgi:hypothetical protein